MSERDYNDLANDSGGDGGSSVVTTHEWGLRVSGGIGGQSDKSSDGSSAGGGRCTGSAAAAASVASANL